MNNIQKEQVMKMDEQLRSIQENLQYIQENLTKLDEPIIIEFLGTPKSGKTTLVTSLENLFKRNDVPVNKKRETAEYNPIQDKTIEEYNIWMIMELMKNISEDVSSKDPKVIIYDRGALDRIPWIETSVNDGSFPRKDVDIIKGLYQSEFMSKYKPLTYGFYTTPETSIMRKGKPGRLVNQVTLTEYNSQFVAAEDFIKERSEKYTHIDTDPYQGKLNSFITDIAERVTTDAKEIIQERLKSKEKPEGPSLDD